MDRCNLNRWDPSAILGGFLRHWEPQKSVVLLLLQMVNMIFFGLSTLIATLAVVKSAKNCKY